jgi:hypothetical protein
MMEESPIIREVRQRAMQIDERFGHDLHKYCAYLREQEKKHADRIVDQISVIRSTMAGKPAK